MINLFKYEDQVFRYENGRLLLRGDNGSGKSRVLALQLPFLLDGEISPHRVEPDRDPAKRMEWHLLMDRHEHRRGYTWMEFSRREDGADCYLTLGCGMEAQRGGGAPKRWFFVTNERVGVDFGLSRDQVPLTRRQLNELLAERGQKGVIDRAVEYRAEVDRHLFQLGARYAPLIELLLQLRQPQLMRDMKEDRLSDALGEALPPIGEALLTEVAESFQSLDSDRLSYETHRNMMESLEIFRAGYRQYLAVAIRRLVAVVRSSQSAYEGAARQLRDLADQIAENQAALEEHRGTSEAAATRRAGFEQQAATLRDSPEMRGKRELDEALRLATERENDARGAVEEYQHAAKELEERLAELEAAESRQREAAELLEKLHLSLKVAYTDLGGADFFMWESDDRSITRKRFGDWLDARRRDVRHLEKLNAALASHESELRKIQGWADDRRGEVDGCTETLRDSEMRRDEALYRFGEDFVEWRASLVELVAIPDERDWPGEVAEWIEHREGSSPTDLALADAWELATQEIADARSTASSEKAEALREWQVLDDELDRLREGRQPEPIPPPTRTSRPADRLGAPFWKLCDFHESIPADERAGWEAALHASGFLDAWVFPDGRMADDLHGDDFLIAAGETPIDLTESMAAVLTADDPVVGRLLQQIGNHSGAGHCWMAKDGRWANGPHIGRATGKAAAEFLGHAAREEARRRRIADLESIMTEIATRIAGFDEQLTLFNARSERLKHESESMPATTPLVKLAFKLDHARSHLASARESLAKADAKVAAAMDTVTAAVAKRNADATDLGLIEVAAVEALAGFSAGLAKFSELAAGFWPHWEGLGRIVEEENASRERAEAAKRQEQRSAESKSGKARRAAEARAHADILEESIGVGAQEIMARLAATDAAILSAKHEFEEAERAATNCRVIAASLAEKIEQAGDKRSLAERERDSAVRRMESFVEHGIFAEYDSDMQPERSEFSTTFAVDLARKLEQELRSHADDENRWNALQAELDATFTELSDQLGRHGLLPRLAYFDDGRAKVITCEFQGKSRGVRELTGLLADELADRERIFHERERAVIENHLIGEAAGELQLRVRGGEDSVTRMNEELSKATTSSGIQLKFSWEQADPADERLSGVRKLFLKAGATWTAEERDRIGDFLQERIRASRENDDTLSWREHLGRALDYRAWHRFVIYRRQGRDDTWKKLTRRTFGTGSGGEKALTLTVPQFAAAAAHYASAGPFAPRLILLDEVFVAIDAPTRGRLMGLLETFDLDYVMTSEREWGTYPSVSALAIYQLASRPGFDAVAVTRWVWNGRNLDRDEAGKEECSTDV